MTEKAASLVEQAKKWAGHYGQFPNGEQGAVLSVPLRLRAYWDAGDADALADLFTEDGSMLVGDEQLRGREEVRAHLAAGFAGELKGTRIADEPVQIKFLEPGVALAVTKGGVVGAGEQDLPAASAVRATWVVAKRDGDWKLVSHQTSPIQG